MIVIPGLSRPLEVVGKRVVSWDDRDGGLFVEVGGFVQRASCPRCAGSSSRTHGRYRRWLVDLPTFGLPVTLAIEVRRFKCINHQCPQRTFSERIDLLAETGQRRTLRLREAQRSLGYALGGAAAARLTARLGMHTSRHTVLRELRRAGCPEPPSAPAVVGIDDWAIARGHRYGTIIVDLERRRPIELMEGRDTTAVMPWLRRQPSIEVIARDRASAYADAGHMVVPGAQQVADRWHLMVNLCEAIERLLLRHAKHMREAARQVSETLRLEAAPVGSLFHTGSVAQRAPRLSTWQRLSNERREARLARYEEAVHHRAQGASIKAIARAMKLDYRTVRNFVRAGSYPERAQRSRGPALSQAQCRYVGLRAAQGCYNATLLWQELRAEGFTGRRSIVHDALARACAATADGNRLRVVAAAAPTMGVPSTRRACAWLLDGKDPESDGQDAGPRRQFVEELCRIEPSIAEARGLGQRFLGFIHRRDLNGFDRWLPRARACAASELRRLVDRFEADLPAVRAAFSSPWSNGQTEGHVNRLKYLKRQMYGRAKLDLLRIRVLHPN